MFWQSAVFQWNHLFLVIILMKWFFCHTFHTCVLLIFILIRVFLFLFFCFFNLWQILSCWKDFLVWLKSSELVKNRPCDPIKFASASDGPWMNTWGFRFACLMVHHNVDIACTVFNYSANQKRHLKRTICLTHKEEKTCVTLRINISGSCHFTASVKQPLTKMQLLHKMTTTKKFCSPLI